MERKVKYTYEFKLRCIEEVLEHHYSVRTVAESNSVSRFNLRLWLRFYQSRGKTSLLSRKNRIYSTEFKLNVLQEIKNKSLSLMDACVEFNISNPCIISEWQSKYLQSGIIGLKSNLKADQEIWITINVKNVNLTNL